MRLPVEDQDYRIWLEDSVMDSVVESVSDSLRDSVLASVGRSL